MITVPEEVLLDKELSEFNSQFNEIKGRNKELSDKLSKMKIGYLRSLSSNTDSAAGKVRRGMAFEIDDCKFHLEAMTRPDYQPLVDDKRIIEKLQERITITNMELIIKREHNEKIIKDIKDNVEKKERQMCKFKLFCVHPVTGKMIESRFKVHQDIKLPQALAEAYKIMKLAPHIPIERCRLVKYDDYAEAMDQSFDLDEFQDHFFGQLVGGARSYYSFEMFLETRKENETFKKYNKGGMKLMIAVIDLSTGDVAPAEPIRAEQGWTVGELKQYIGEIFNLDPSCMRLILEVYKDGRHLPNDASSLKGEGLYRKHTLFVASDSEDYDRQYKESFMYKHVDAHINSVLLYITLPPFQEHTPGRGEEEEKEDVKSKPSSSVEGRKGGGGGVLKVVSFSRNEEEKGKKRDIQIRVDQRTTLAQLKEELVPLIGVPPTGFKVYRVYNNQQEYEMERLTDSLMAIPSESRFVVRLGRALQVGECRIKLFLLHIDNTEFFNLMMESVVAKNTPVREFKKQIIEEAKVQGIDCVLELDKMRLRKKTWRSPGTVYLDHQLIDKDIHVYAGSEMYVEPLKEPEKMKLPTQMQVYVRRWRPSECSVDPTEEVILDTASPLDLKKKLSELSEVPVDAISVAKGLGSFPAEISCLDIENELEWDPAIQSISQTPFSLYDDGGVIYYKDNREKMKEITAKERAEIEKTENKRINSVRVYGTGSSSSSGSKI
ncbi:PREDICTED: ubiquitin carboxyl-terminal hydrolase 47-like [Amphimedon queenslandica]|uniref:Ubiquitin-like domain-containing protein n=1 Tax=Amphimedon queenslandica TaxID=400682 RepID=A0AAN0J840_AMPQE|nr:PREDICTED: ubiquitin carboxyl-terminal hydrolase 47-like [Amphimedon queenslandica]|eukprot:XP_019853184.1 PREDICTED: ubiquitin carboxyl-terminal hydrolase 47-like [Amphimedon queenslandica]